MAGVREARAPTDTPLASARPGGGTPQLINPGELIITPDSAGIKALANYSLTTPPDEGTKHLKGKHGKVYIVRPSTKRGFARKRSPIAIKRQMIKVNCKRRLCLRSQNPKNPNDMAFRDFRISEQLQSLRLPNFLEVKGLARVFAQDLNRVPFASPDVVDKENSQYLHSIMEYGGSETLHARKTVSVAELRAFSFQVIFALYKAQKKYQFVHGDLHLKNLMLKPTTMKLVYEDGGLVWEMDGPVVKIIDFGLSRLRLTTGEILFNDKAKLRDLYSATADYEQLAGGFGALKVANWDSVPAAEREDWRDLRRRLLKGSYQSAEELVRHRFFEPLRLKPRTKFLPPVPSFSAQPVAAVPAAAPLAALVAAPPPPKAAVESRRPLSAPPLALEPPKPASILTAPPLAAIAPEVKALVAVPARTVAAPTVTSTHRAIATKKLAAAKKGTGTAATLTHKALSVTHTSATARFVPVARTKSAMPSLKRVVSEDTAAPTAAPRGRSTPKRAASIPKSKREAPTEQAGEYVSKRIRTPRKLFGVE